MCHGRSGWLEYHRAARQQRAIDPAKPWNVLDHGLHSSFILSRSSAAAVKRCTACQGVDHTTNQCALASIEPAVQQAGAEPRRRSYICASWNRGVAASRQGTPRLHLKVGGVIRPHLSNDWWIPNVELVIYDIDPIHLFYPFINSIDCML